MADETTRVKYPSGENKFSKQILKYPKDLDEKQKNFAWTKFRFFTYKPPLTIQRERSENGGQQFSNYNKSVNTPSYVGPTIALYSPEDIQAEYGVQWGGRSIQNFTREAIANVSNGGGGIIGTFKDLATGGGADTGAYAFSALAAAGLQALQNIGQGEGIGLNDLLGGTAGVVLNPNTELLFQGFDLRNFNLQYKFVARSRPEADEIQKIIRNFKYAMLPGLSGAKVDDKVDIPTLQDLPEDADPNAARTINQDGNETLLNFSKNFISVPYLCDMAFMYGSGPNPYITQFKPCAITGITINQTPDGLLSLYQRGEPTAITMNISFQETKLVYREEINLSPNGFTY